MNSSVYEDLQRTASVANFSHVPTSAFRQEVRSCLSKILSESQSRAEGNVKTDDDGFIRYNPLLLANFLSAGIDWKTLGEHHDKIAKRSSPTFGEGACDTSTPLQEIVRLLLDPTLMSFALSGPLLRVLVRAFLLHGSSPSFGMPKSKTNNVNPIKKYCKYSGPNFTPTQSLLARSIIWLMKNRQCRVDLGEIIWKVYRVDFGNKDPSFRIRQSVLSLIIHCMCELKCPPNQDYCSVQSMFPCLLTLIHSVLSDGCDILQESSNDGSICTSCGVNKHVMNSLSDLNQRRRPGFLDMATLHGEVDEDHSGNKSTRALRYNAMQSQQNYNAICPNCQSTASGPLQQESGAVIDRDAICSLRDNCIQTMVSFFQSTVLQLRQRSFRLLRSTLSSVFKLDSPYLRICVLQLADMLGKDGYDCLLSSLWDLARNENVIYLRWFSEIIVESTFCNDRQKCWDSMKPLIERIKKLHAEENSQQTENNRQCCQRLLPFFGYIFSRRWQLLQSTHDSIYEEIISLVVNLCGSFGDPKSWITPSHEETILIAEQASANNPDSGKRNELALPHRVELQQAYQLMTWYPCSPFAASAVVHKHSIIASLLSDLDHDQKQLAVQPELKEDLVVEEEGLPILGYLDEDVLRNVFSFLGFRKLLRVRLCCKAWKIIADEEQWWYNLHRQRFGLLGNDSPSKADASSTSPANNRVSPTLWKDRFSCKWLAARAIRFQSNKTQNFPYKICSYVDCYHVIKSPSLMKSHYAMHQRRKLLQETQERVRQQKAKAAEEKKAPAKDVQATKRSRSRSVKEQSPKKAAATVVQATTKPRGRPGKSPILKHSDKEQTSNGTVEKKAETAVVQATKRARDLSATITRPAKKLKGEDDSTVGKDDGHLQNPNTEEHDNLER